MQKVVDPIKLVEKNLAARKSKSQELRKAQAAIQSLVASAEESAAREDSITYEVPLVPPRGTKVLNLTCASTYRDPIPVQFDPNTRTCYPTLKAQ